MKELVFQPLTIEHRQMFDKFFQHCQPKISEYTFTNLFIWRVCKQLQFTTHEEGFFLKAVDKEGIEYIYPPLGFEDCQKTYEFLSAYCKESGINRVRLVPEFQLKFVHPYRPVVTADRDNFDYLYKTSSLATLKGWRLDGKRGFVKKFAANYDYQYLPYINSLKEKCYELYDSWYHHREAVDPTVHDEYVAFHEFLDNFERLGSVGGVIMQEGRVIAFSFGERLSDTTFVVHFEKADPSFTGSYQMINQLFVQHEALNRYQFINREQDMGIEGIRKAKLSYVPFRMIKKYTVSFI